MAMTPQELHDAAIWWSDALQVAGAGFRARLDMAAKHRLRDAREDGSYTDYDRDFFREVCPQLNGYIRLSAYLVGQGLETFSQACARVMAVATQRGAWNLSPGADYDLREWIDNAICACVDEPKPKDLISPERLVVLTGEPRE